MGNRKIEYCCLCYAATGNEGRGDGSIFIEIDRIDIGPLCEDCYKELLNQKYKDANNNI